MPTDSIKTPDKGATEPTLNGRGNAGGQNSTQAELRAIKPTMGTLSDDQGELTAAAPEAAERKVLESLPNRVRLTGEDAQARSRTVRRLRIILPLIALGLVTIFFFTSQDVVDDPLLEDLALENVTAKEASVTRPTFAGLDRDGQPFEVTADSGTQDPDLDNTVRLTEPKAVMRDGETVTHATANNGTFQSDQSLLHLKDNVTLEREISGNTYILKAPEATVAVDQETVTSQSGVTGVTDKGRLRADTMEVDNNSGVIVFRGRVLMKFDPKSDNLPDQTTITGATSPESASPDSTQP